MVSVNTIQPATVFVWFMFIMIIGRIVLIVIIGIIGRNRPLQSDRVPEDKFLKKGYTIANKIINNDSENDTYFLILLFATTIFSDSINGDCVRTIVYGVFFYLVFRISYTITYIFALQPWRTLSFFLGLTCTLICSFDFVITMSNRSN